MRACLRPACIVLLLACGRDEGRPAPDPRQVSSAPVDSLGRLDPTPYRAKIEAAEALLYDSEALSDDGWKQLSQALLELHNEIVFHDESASARETSAQLFFLSARADATTTRKRDGGELAELRELWRRLSDEKFAPAVWIRAGAAMN